MDVFAPLSFAQPDWLWLLPLVPVAVIAGELVHRWLGHRRQLAYAEAHLLPALRRDAERGVWVGRMRVLLLWILVLTAFAGPRWGYTDISVREPQLDLMVLVDLSRSMQATDVSPSRIARARQELRDLLAAEPPWAWSVGVLGYASIPYTVAPLTNDLATLEGLVARLDTGLARWGGSRPRRALLQAAENLRLRPESAQRAVLLITDGDFGAGNLVDAAGALREQGITLHVLGIGSQGGAVLEAENGAAVRTSLDAAGLAAAARAGGGQFAVAEYLNADTEALIRAFGEGFQGQASPRVRRVHNEVYMVPLAAAMVLLASMFPGLGRPRVGRKAVTG